MNVKAALEKLARYNGDQGTAWNDESNLRRLNDVRELLYERGDFEGTTEFVVLRDGNREFCLPETSETIRAAAHCFHPITILNKNNQFAYVNSTDAHRMSRWEGNCHQVHIRESNNKKPYSCNIGVGFRFSVRACNPTDFGTEIHFQCKKQGRERNFSLKVVGMVDSTLTCNQSDSSVDDILLVTKPITQGYIELYVPATNQVIATWNPRDESPMFTWYSIHRETCRFRPLVPEACHHNQSVLFCKKRFLPILDYNAQLDIGSISGLKFGYQAFNKQEADDDQGYAAKIQLMENALSKSDFNLTPGDEILTMSQPEYETLVQGPNCFRETSYYNHRLS